MPISSGGLSWSSLRVTGGWIGSILPNHFNQGPGAEVFRGAQLLTATQFESSSAHIENMAIAFEVTQDRNYQSAPSSTLRLQVTGQGLGGASKHEIQELNTQVKIAEAQVSVFRDSYIPKVMNKLQKAKTAEKSRKYQKKLHELRRDLVAAQENLAACQAALANAQGASGSR